jgi:hypothetical protein
MTRKSRLPRDAVCSLCGSSHHVQVHHIDWHHDNDVPENRYVVCEQCQAEIHKAGFMDREALDRVRSVVEARNPDRFSRTNLPDGQTRLF